MADSTDIARKIRALLDRAENTPYPAEAEAATRKAAELMAAHRISEAMVAAARPGAGDVITTRHVRLARGPYVNPRTSLLNGVAEGFGVRMVFRATWDGRDAELLGYASDLDAVELLYTSLLVQASVAVAAESIPRGHAAVRWRRGFLLGFAHAVSDRLQQVMRDAVRDAQQSAGTSSSVALVLADRDARLNDEYQRRYGRVGHARASAPVTADSHLLGMEAGRRADLGRDGRLPDSPRGLRRGA